MFGLRKFLNRRMGEATTWAGVGSVLHGAGQILAGAGSTTPEVLERAGEAANQVGVQVAAGGDPFGALVQIGLGIALIFAQTSHETKPIIR